MIRERISGAPTICNTDRDDDGDGDGDHDDDDDVKGIKGRVPMCVMTLDNDQSYIMLSWHVICIVALIRLSTWLMTTPSLDNPQSLPPSASPATWVAGAAIGCAPIFPSKRCHPPPLPPASLTIRSASAGRSTCTARQQKLSISNHSRLRRHHSVAETTRSSRR